MSMTYIDIGHKIDEFSALFLMALYNVHFG